jgi:hypothetical protein
MKRGGIGPGYTTIEIANWIGPGGTCLRSTAGPVSSVVLWAEAGIRPDELAMLNFGRIVRGEHAF